MTGQHIQQDAIYYQWFNQQQILSVSEPSISHRLKRTPSNHLCLPEILISEYALS